MIDRNGIYCDGDKCNASIGNHYMSFEAKILHAIDEKWQRKKLFNTWFNYCPDCQTQPVRSRRAPRRPYDPSEHSQNPLPYMD